jgi:hypothetical protein
MERAFKKGGEKGFWREQLELQLPAGTYHSPGEQAWVYASAGQTDKAFFWLEQAYEEREGQVITLLKLDPAFKQLRSDPRFSALLQKMGLPQ